MQEINRGLRSSALNEIAGAMRKSGEAMSYPEMLSQQGEVIADKCGNRSQRRKAKAEARKSMVSA